MDPPRPPPPEKIPGRKPEGHVRRFNMLYQNTTGNVALSLLLTDTIHSLCRTSLNSLFEAKVALDNQKLSLCDVV